MTRGTSPLMRGVHGGVNGDADEGRGVRMRRLDSQPTTVPPCPLPAPQGFIPSAHGPAGCVSAYADVVEALSNTSWMRYYDGWLQSVKGQDPAAVVTGTQLLPALLEETKRGVPVIVHADPRVFASHSMEQGRRGDRSAVAAQSVAVGGDQKKPKK